MLDIELVYILVLAVRLYISFSFMLRETCLISKANANSKCTWMSVEGLTVLHTNPYTSIILTPT